MSTVLWSVFTMLQGTVGWIGMTGSLAAMTLFLMRFMLGWWNPRIPGKLPYRLQLVPDA